MAINLFSTWKTRSEAPDEQIFHVEALNTGGVARLISFWTNAPFVGAAPTTAAVPSRTILGALGQKNGVGRLCIGDYKSLTGIIIGGGMMMIIDRLSHQGGLDGTVISAQTTNLPTAALTRYTTGDGVLAAIEIYTLIGATATTISVSYTNQAGTSGKISPDTVFGGSGYNAAQRFIPIPLASGDTGFRSVESVTVLASTGTAGNFGILLFKPLTMFPTKCDFTPSHWNALIQGGCQLPKIETDACLQFVGQNGANSFAMLQGVINFIDA